MDSRMDQYQRNNTETLSEWLGLLKITKENDLEKTTEYMNNMSTVPALAVYNEIVQAVMPKSIVPSPEWFDGNQTKFEN